MREVAEDYVEAVLDLVGQIPSGRATTYGVLAETLRERTGRGGARLVGTVMARYGGGVPWWRVVRADGGMAEEVRSRALVHWRAESIPLRRTDPPRVDLYRAGWEPGEMPGPSR